MGCAPRSGNHVEAVVALAESKVRCAGDDRDAFVGENLLDGRGDVGVFTWRKPRSPPLEHGDARAEPAIHLGELEADVAAADDHQMFGQGVEFEDATLVR